MLKTKRSKILVVFLLVFLFIDLVLFVLARRATAPDYIYPQDKFNITNYRNFNTNNINQIKGLVLEKKEQPRTLVLRQGSDREVKMAIRPEAKITKVIWNEEGKSIILTGDYWYEIQRGSEITGVCQDTSCQVLTSLFINSKKPETK